MDKIIKHIEKEFVEELDKIPERLTPQNIGSIRPLADIAAIYSGLAHYKMEHHEGMERSGWVDEIADELRSAEEKYAEYQKSNDTTMLEMARQELNHANYYINKAKMSPDMKLREKVPEYEKRYAEIAKKINAPHGGEKIGRL